MQINNQDTNVNLEYTIKPSGPFQWCAETDVGKVRPENEDSFFADPENALFIVTDGMGGHRGGALASGIIAEDLPVMIENALDKLKVGNTRTVKAILKKVIAEQSRQLYLEGMSESGYKDMGATLVVVLLKNKRCFVANVGDSRVYRLRNGRLRQLTRDHSVVSELIEQGYLKPEDAQNHAASGQLTSYIGMEKKTHSHIHSFALKKGDRILLCTDGLTDMLDDKQITDIVKNQTELQDTCKSLISAANKAGGHDNVTTLLIDWL